MSVTDRCDFRCIYCMDEKMTFMPRAQLLTLEELAWVGRAFVELGVNKIRITGGEPLVRHGILQLFEQLSALPGLKELVITTNGSQLAKMAQSIKDAGVKRINISLDTLKADRFQKVTRTGKLDNTLKGIEASLNVGFKRIKLNAVILKGRNHDEVTDLVNFVIDRDMDISFIEEMPLGLAVEHDYAALHYSSDQIRDDLSQTFTLLPTTESTAGPSKYYRVANTETRIGFISPHSHNFCDACNRVRMTTEGRLLLCLGQENSVDLKRVVRAHPGEIEPLKQAIVAAMQFKPKNHEFELNNQPKILRHMNVTGG